MRRFITNIILFAVVVAAIDFTFGLVMDYMHIHSQGGGMAKRLYMVREAEDEVMMFGSSRMNHHYNPMIIEDSLGLTCYNAGQEGCGILMSYGFLKMMMERYTPKLVVYDISGFDFTMDDNMKHIMLLKPYYDDTSVKEIITDVSPMDRYKMLSSMYRYNSLVVRVMGSFFSHSTEYQKGYLPLHGTMDYDVEEPEEKQPVVDELKLKYLRKLIELCQGKDVPLVFALSPRYKAKDSSFYEEVKAMAIALDVPFLDHYNDALFSHNRSYFQDQTHMNSAGADEYTKRLVVELRSYLNK